MKTKAWVLVDYNKLELWDIETPYPTKDQVLVEIHYTSICGSQLNEISGKKGPDKYFPHLMGHEAVGIVRDVGDNNYSYLKDRTVICTWISDYINKAHKVSVPKYRNVNAGPITTFAQYSVIDYSKIIPISLTMCPELALFGCTVPTGAGSLLRYVSPYQNKVLILGLGGVGMSAAIFAQGHSWDIYGFDTNDKKWNDAIDSKLIKRWHPTMMEGEFDIVLECSGSTHAMELGFEKLKAGGKLLLAGNAAPDAKISINPFDFIRGKNIKGIVGGDCDHIDITSLAHGGVEKYKPLISKEYPLEQLDQAVYDMQTGQIIKPIIKCQ